jgi:hypothetical protein
MTTVNFIKEVKEFDFLRGSDSYIVIGVSSTFTIEVFNVSTWEEETIEGDYLDKGNIAHLGLINTGNIESYILTMDSRAVAYKQKLTDKVNELKEFYYA